MNYEETRINKLRTYLFDVINDENVKQINADMLSNDIDNYSLDKIPMESAIEKWICGIELHQDTFNFRSRKAYSQDVINNLTNIGFFENFEKIINSNNEKGILPEIDGIEKIECLNCGTLNITDTNTAIFDIQIRIQYRVNTFNI